MQFKLSSAISFNLDQSKTLSSGNGLIYVFSKKVPVLANGNKKLEEYNSQYLSFSCWLDLIIFKGATRGQKGLNFTKQSVLESFNKCSLY